MEIGKIVRIVVIPEPIERPLEEPIPLPDDWPVRKEVEVDA